MIFWLKSNTRFCLKYKASNNETMRGMVMTNTKFESNTRNKKPFYKLILLNNSKIFSISELSGWKHVFNFKSWGDNTQVSLLDYL